ncbi:hypothetical protein QC762_310780 [Podospora pseudocomata]|uniref:ribonuclease H n=1 Tax=Podospora pseudocomata TaxID=2093779 RepID=A0ABR0GL84_9PEZI|nr:hypothetical protein QC762_310780 [Podospora pseudocomata]
MVGMPQVCPQLPYLWLLFGNPFPLEQPARPDIPLFQKSAAFPRDKHQQQQPRTLDPATRFSELEWRKGAGLVFPTEFTHPSASATPTDLFKVFRPKNGLLKYVHRTDAFTALIFIAGTCPDRRTPDPKAGWALVHARAPARPITQKSKRPFGDDGSQTSNRAELRAALATLRFEFGPNEEGFRTLVIVINSKYVVEGSTTWAETWIEKQWKTSEGEDVANRDLWEALLGEIEKAKERNMAVQFWKIPKEWNVDAHDAAMKATEQPAADSFQDQI